MKIPHVKKVALAIALVGALGTINAGQEEKLLKAVRDGKTRQVKRLLKAGANPDATHSVGGKTALQEAAEKKNKELVEILLSNGAEINKKDNYGYTPISWALEGYNNKDILEILIDAGADVTLANDIGETPLHKAVFQRDKEAIRLLLNAGANPFDQKITKGVHKGKTAYNFAFEDDIKKLLKDYKAKT